MKLNVRIRGKSAIGPAEKDDENKIVDSDADGICDKEEEKLGTDPCDPDSDHDGLPDYEEAYVYGTDPLDPDTDHDGMSDGEEVSLGYDPLGPGKLKDFFIASQSNNHKPHALHVRRILFYAAAALAVKAVVVISLLTLPIGAWLDPNVAVEQSRKIIGLTNQVRAKLGIGELKESFSLDQAAAAKAQDMLDSQYFAHVSPDNKNLNFWLQTANYSFLFAGENLAMGFSDASDVVNAWIQSKTHYANLIDKDYTEIGVAMVSGKYKDYETTFVAQMFGKPVVAQVSAPAPAAPSQETRIEPKISDAPARQVDSVKTSEPATAPDIEAPAPKPLQQAAAKPSAVQQSRTTTAPAKPAEKPAPPALQPPAKPVIIEPESNYLSGKAEQAFKVVASDARKVLIVSDGKTIASSTDREKDYFKVSAIMDSGIHKIVAVAEKDGLTSESAEILATIDLEPPQIDAAKSSLTVMSEDNEHDVVAVTAFLSADTVTAEASFSSYNIQLAPDASDPNKWTGEALIFKEDNQEIFNPVVLASVTATDYAGSTVTQDIVWGNIIPAKQSLLNQYLYLKNNQSPYARMLFDVSSMFYNVLLVISILVLSANIYFQLHKRHPHVIMSALGLIVLLVVLILV